MANLLVSTPNAGPKADHAGRTCFFKTPHRHRCGNRLLVGDRKLVVQIVGLMLEMLFQREGQLSPAYCCQDPTNNRMQNVLFRLHRHLTHKANAGIIPRLVQVAHGIGPHAYRLLKLLCPSLFAHQLYRRGPLLARGGFAQVPSLGPHPSVITSKLVSESVSQPNVGSKHVKRTFPPEDVTSSDLSLLEVFFIATQKSSVSLVVQCGHS